MSPVAHAEIVVDVAAIRRNVGLLRELVAPAALMVVVKADGYGHGIAEASRAARAAGAEWLGVATVDEALQVRDSGDTGRLLCWLDVPGEDYTAAIARDVDVTAYSVAELDAVEAAAGSAAGTAMARVQLKVDTGLSRGGCPREDWPALVAHARAAEQRGTLTVTGIWSHFACSDEPDHPANDAQDKAFRDALDVAEQAGLRPEVRHLSNSAGAILRPQSRYDLVRCGIASYGLDPAPGTTPDLGLVPAMTVTARLALTKRLEPGDGVSYGHTWVADHETYVGLVPLGYADGVPRQGSNLLEVQVAGRRAPVRGRVCMDQLVVDLGDGDPPEPGTEVVLFGPGTHGEPTATEWASAIGTINYEIVTRIGGRAVRRHVDTQDQGGRQQ